MVVLGEGVKVSYSQYEKAEWSVASKINHSPWKFIIHYGCQMHVTVINISSEVILNYT
jgi:hypothetical protein